MLSLLSIANSASRDTSRTRPSLSQMVGRDVDSDGKPARTEIPRSRVARCDMTCEYAEHEDCI